MTHLFEPFQSRSLTLKNRIAMSPMCQYSSHDGFANDWHLVHLGSRAVGGVGLVLTEATAVLAEGRISPQDLGIWDDVHVEALARITAFIGAQGVPAGIQLAHAGRKGSTYRPWDERRGTVPAEEGGWRTIGPSDIAFEGFAPPRAMDSNDIAAVVRAFADAARRALRAGFKLIEIHAAHGYLLHQFLSPLSNRRTDEYGGSFDGRIRLTLEVFDAVRKAWPEELPIWIRLSATDWVEGGWDVDDTVELARRLKHAGVDLIDVSSGGTAAKAEIPVGPGYQTPFAERVRREARIPSGAIGMITAPEQSEHILRTGQADIVLLARELLREPYWPLRAATELRQEVAWPPQYARAAGRRVPLRPG